MNAEPLPATPQPSLAALSDAWNAFGCSICSYVPSPYAMQGARIELHHILSRGQGGTDEAENLMGLCAEMCPEKCHWRVTQNRVSIRWAENLSGWVWHEPATGIHGLCRPLDADLITEAGVAGRTLVPSRETLAVRGEMPVEWLPADVATEAGVAGAQARFLVCRELHLTAERAWLRLALVVHYSMMLGDYGQLGFETVKQWADAVGFSPATLSKLRLVGRVFEGSWMELPAADRAMLTMDGLYLTARQVKLGVLSRDEALADAVSKPVAVIWQDFLNNRPETVLCTCRDCGQVHRKKEEPLAD